jgi:serine/threonine protein kinase
VLKELGNGAFGQVFMVEDEQGQKFALKRTLKISNIMSREIEILQKVQ